MGPTICKCCGQTLPQPLKLSIKLRPGTLRLVERVARAGTNGVPTDVLFDYLYGGDPNGGPIGGKNVLASRISQLNKRLRADNVCIRGTMGRGENVYIWEKL